jgi:hypothetical protein
MGKTLLKSYLDEFVAYLKSDDSTVLGEKVWRQSQNALKLGIASANVDTMKYQGAVEKAVEELKVARLNRGNMIEDASEYVLNLIKAKQAVVDAEENLRLHLEKLEVLSTELELNINGYKQL